MVSLIEDGVEAGDLFSVMLGGDGTGIMGQIIDRTVSLMSPWLGEEAPFE